IVRLLKLRECSVGEGRNGQRLYEAYTVRISRLLGAAGPAAEARPGTLCSYLNRYLTFGYIRNISDASRSVAWLPPPPKRHLIARGSPVRPCGRSFALPTPGVSPKPSR